MARLQADEYTALAVLRVSDVLERIVAECGLDPEAFADDLFRARKQAHQAIRERNRPDGQGDTE